MDTDEIPIMILLGVFIGFVMAIAVFMLNTAEKEDLDKVCAYLVGHEYRYDGYKESCSYESKDGTKSVDYYFEDLPPISPSITDGEHEIGKWV